MLRVQAEGWTCKGDKEVMADKTGKIPSGILKVK